MQTRLPSILDGSGTSIEKAAYPGHGVDPDTPFSHWRASLIDHSVWSKYVEVYDPLPLAVQKVLSFPEQNDPFQASFQTAI